jgi:hypothetical protein
MDYAFFEKVSKEEAEIFLSNFLNEAGQGFISMIPEMEANGLIVDYSTASITPIFTWITQKLRTFPLDVDESLPVWIRETDSYKNNLYSFDKPSNILILRAAYYVGESFTRNYKQLKWSIGRAKTVEKNMPVVKGFVKKIELAPLMVCENVFGRTVTSGSFERITSVVDTWVSFISH